MRSVSVSIFYNYGIYFSTKKNLITNCHFVWYASRGGALWATGRDRETVTLLLLRPYYFLVRNIFKAESDKKWRATAWHTDKRSTDILSVGGGGTQTSSLITHGEIK